MEVLHRRCAGLDVHKKTGVASVRLAEENRVTTEVKTFATTTAGLLTLSDWLSANDCAHVAMEATGVYWRPVWRVLSDGEFQLILANATWLAELLAHGLIRASFVPDGQTQELRALVRTRKPLARERSRHTQRIHKVLEDANLKIDAELSDTLEKERPGDPRRPGGRRDRSGPACSLGASQREVPASQAGLRRCGGECRVIIGSCCNSISKRSMGSMPQSARWTAKSKPISRPFASPSTS